MHEREELHRAEPLDGQPLRLGDPPLSGDHQALESLLGSFAPAASRVDRDRLMFRAGQASALAEQSNQEKASPPLRAWTWPFATAVMTGTALLLTAALVLRPEPPPRVVYVDRPASQGPTESHLPPLEASPQPEAKIAKTTPSVKPASQRFADAPELRYLQNREIALTLGVEALPKVSPSSGGLTRAALPQRELLEAELPRAAAEFSRWEPFGGAFSWPLVIPTEDNL